jgi:hypothetical protein
MIEQPFVPNYHSIESFVELKKQYPLKKKKECVSVVKWKWFLFKLSYNSNFTNQILSFITIQNIDIIIIVFSYR